MPRAAALALNELNWPQDEKTAFDTASRALTHPTITSVNVGLWIESLQPSRRRDLLNRSVERPTHYKWFMGETVSGVVCWLHQYKDDPSGSGIGFFARSVHDHRYSFVSKVLAGTLHMQDYSVPVADGLYSPPVPEDTSHYNQGSVYKVTWTQIHGVTGWKPGTTTILLQSPVYQAVSHVYDLEGRTVRDVPDLSRVLETMTSVLKATAD
jgi:hypothetical protein